MLVVWHVLQSQETTGGVGQHSRVVVYLAQPGKLTWPTSCETSLASKANEFTQGNKLEPMSKEEIKI